MWPFTRKPATVTIVLRHEGLDGVADALLELADAKRYEARVRAGLIHAKTKEGAKVPPEWDRWERSNRDIEDTERLHLRWAYDVLTGTEAADAARKIEATNLYRKAQEAGYGLPDLDGRVVAARNGHERSEP